MKKKLLLLISIFLSSMFFIIAQETVSSTSGVSANWADISNPWNRACNGGSDIDRPDRNDCAGGLDIGPNNVSINHNTNTSMKLNGAWFQVQTLTLGALATSNRGFTADPQDGSAGLSLYGGIVNNSGAWHAFSTPVSIEASEVTIDAANHNLIFYKDIHLNANELIFTGASFPSVSGVIDGTGILRQRGTASLELSADNTYTGNTIIESGAIVLRGNLASHTVIVGNGAHLIINDTDVEINNLTVFPTGQVWLNKGKSLTVNGNIIVMNTGRFHIFSGDTGSGSLITHGTVTGDIIIHRYFSEFANLPSSDGWHFLSSPVSSQAISDFQTLPGDNDFYKWDEAAGEWDNRKDYLGGLDPSFEENFTLGQGYLVGYDVDTDKEFVGAIRTTDFTTPSLSFSGSDPEYKGWNLIGNPFTSAIDWDIVTRDIGVNGEIQIIKSDGTGYAVYNAGGGDLIDGIIPAGKAFMVQTTADNKTLTMGINARVHSANDYKSSNSTEDMINVKVRDGEKFTSMFIRFNNQATNDFDGLWDAHKLLNFCSVAQVYTYDENTLYAINSLPSTNKIHTVNMAVKTFHDGEYTLEFNDIVQFSSLYKIQFEDKETGILLEIEEGTQYTFSADEGDHKNRFKLYFGATGIEDLEASDIRAYMSGNNLMILGETGQAQLSIFNMEGKQLLNEQVELMSEYKKTLYFPSGVYVVRVQTSEFVKTNKIVIK